METDSGWIFNGPDGEGDYHIREHGNGDCVAHTKSPAMAEMIVSQHNGHQNLIDLLVEYVSRRHTAAMAGEWVEFDTKVARALLTDYGGAKECSNKRCTDGWVDRERGNQDGTESWVEQVPCQVCRLHCDLAGELTPPKRR